jgi:glycosyltransferase involved in cell wall biosynthesis
MHVSLLAPAPFSGISGGYAYDRRIVAGLRAAGHTVEVIELPGRHPLPDDAAYAGVCTAWDALAAGTRPVIDGLALPAFAELRANLEGRNAVGLIHHPTALETGFSDADRIALRRTEQRLMPELARVIVTSTPTADRLAAEFGVKPERIAVVVPGTEDAPRSAGSADGVCRILSVGTLVPRKGHDVLLRALARLFDLEWRLTIVGAADRDPVHARSLTALAEQLGIAARVDFAGEVADDALDTLWRDADIFALATHWEGYGMAVAEALKRGVPPAVTAGGAAGALVPAEGGVVCPAGDVDGLSKSLRRLVFDAALRQHMAEVAFRAGESLPSWSTQVAAFAKALA